MVLRHFVIVVICFIVEYLFIKALSSIDDPMYTLLINFVLFYTSYARFHLSDIVF